MPRNNGEIFYAKNHGEIELARYALDKQHADNSCNKCFLFGIFWLVCLTSLDVLKIAMASSGSDANMILVPPRSDTPSPQPRPPIVTAEDEVTIDDALKVVTSDIERLDLLDMKRRNENKKNAGGGKTPTEVFLDRLKINGHAGEYDLVGEIQMSVNVQVYPHPSLLGTTAGDSKHMLIYVPLQYDMHTNEMEVYAAIKKRLVLESQTVICGESLPAGGISRAQSPVPVINESQGLPTTTNNIFRRRGYACEDLADRPGEYPHNIGGGGLPFAYPKIARD
jgi:hypothetical protein